MRIGKQIGRIFGGDTLAVPARRIYAGIVSQARQPAFYTACGVPDSLDGRFELVALHAFLVLRRLNRGAGGEPSEVGAADLAQTLVDTLVQDMDRSLREMGVGDLGVSRRVKEMARGFYGRIAAYEAGLDGTGDMLEAALMRNLYGTVEAAPEVVVAAMTTYIQREAASLDDQDIGDLMAGTVAFGPPPEGLGRETV